MKTLRLLLLSVLMLGATYTPDVYGMTKTGTEEETQTRKRTQHPEENTEASPSKKAKTSGDEKNGKDAKDEKALLPESKPALASETNVEQKAPVQPALSPFDITSLNARLAKIKIAGGILELEASLTTSIVKITNAIDALNKVIALTDNFKICCSTITSIPKKIMLWHISETKKVAVACIKYTIYAKEVKIVSVYGTGEIFEEIMGTGLEYLIKFAAIYEGSHYNKNEKEKLYLATNHTESLNRIFTYLDKIKE